ncbi:SPOR domain-containing protein [Spiribacter vilamensis]|uniref:DedD protein n=1 Tax=Spiribacter vilamensis TaxID=531306 RepID=A0A4Q8CYL6_9GAMM|nr:SPOR domain-containing protein [Spiribacter vilamensis]RZU97990.1 DedD protein [Spiribacter vilamensis]TVO61098.1 hypothetical protein FPL09_02795 [Spiribacter vilamensis]
MEQRIKQRLVGAVVLVALGVIFLPMLLSGPVERTRVDIQLDMPAEPVLDDAPALPDGSTVESPQPGRALADQPALGEGDAVPDPAPAPVSPDAGSAFYVQVGAFGSLDNARRLAGRLTDDDLDVRIAEDDREGRLPYRVQVGPLDSEAAAEQMAQRLADGFDLPGFIVEP